MTSLTQSPNVTPAMTSEPEQEHAHHTLDRCGMALSLGCAIHCALLPLAMTFLTAAGLAWIAGPELEWAVLGGTLLVGSYQLVRSYRRHKRVECLGLFAVGLIAFLIAKSQMVTFDYSEAVLMSSGGLLVASAHFRNLRIGSNCGCER